MKGRAGSQNHGHAPLAVTILEPAPKTRSSLCTAGTRLSETPPAGHGRSSKPYNQKNPPLQIAPGKPRVARLALALQTPYNAGSSVSSVFVRTLGWGAMLSRRGGPWRRALPEQQGPQPWAKTGGAGRRRRPRRGTTRTDPRSARPRRFRAPLGKAALSSSRSHVSVAVPRIGLRRFDAAVEVNRAHAACSRGALRPRDQLSQS